MSGTLKEAEIYSVLLRGGYFFRVSTIKPFIYLRAEAVKVKVKLSLYRLNRSRGLQEVEAARIFRRSTHEGGKSEAKTSHCGQYIKFRVTVY